MARTRHDDEEGDARAFSASRENRFPTDIRLRSFGFRIYSRPDSFTAVWWKDGRTWTQAEALAHCSRKVKGVATP